MRHFSLYAFALMFLLCSAVHAQQSSLTLRNGGSDPCSHFKMQIIVPSDTVDFKLRVTKPPEGIDFKMSIINPCPSELPQFAFTLPVITQHDKSGFSFFAPKPFQFGITPKSYGKHQALDFSTKPHPSLTPVLKQK